MELNSKQMVESPSPFVFSYACCITCYLMQLVIRLSTVTDYSNTGDLRLMDMWIYKSFCTIDGKR